MLAVVPVIPATGMSGQLEFALRLTLLPHRSDQEIGAEGAPG
jgi:hypothetical protein